MAKTEILIEDSNLEYDLNEEDVLEYAKQIGIDVKNEKHLMWIAEEGLRASVPNHWLILSDEKGNIFYCNKETGQKSWLHPLDSEYSALVIKERQKDLNSPLSCGYESKNSLSSIHDGSQSPGRFPKAPLPQLSSLSDAPPLSSSGKTTPASLKNTSISEKKRDLGHFENRRGTKLAPVKLNTLKMPAQKSPSTMSFMPKGSALSKNIRRTIDEPDITKSQFSSRPQIGLPQDDLNESFNSDDGSKYSYEETEDDMERSYDDMNPSDVGSQLSPSHSNVGSPEALDINSLVQLGTKLPSRLDSSKKTLHLQSLKEEQSPSLNLRKSGQPSFLKPLQQQSKKKASPKTGKKKTTSSLNNKFNQYPIEEEELDSKIATLNEEQRLRFESIQREWAAMQDELVKDEKKKYDKMVVESSKKLEEDELLLRKENAEKLSIVKGELEKKIKEETNSIEVILVDIKKANAKKYEEEENKHKDKLEALSQTLREKLKQLELENEEKISNKKDQLNVEFKSTVDEISASQKNSLKDMAEAHAVEITFLEKAHKEKIEGIQTAFTKEENQAKGEPLSTPDNSIIEIQKINKQLKEDQAKLHNELEELQSRIAAEKETLKIFEEKTAAAQTSFEEIQDEVDKTENDLDLLRTEKSTLISELNILKDNIKNEKSNLVKEKTLNNEKPETSNKGVSASLSSLVVCKGIQTCVESRDISCQMKAIEVSKMEKQCQTLEKASMSNFSCQVDLVHQSTGIKAHNLISFDGDNNGTSIAHIDMEKVNGVAIENQNGDVFDNKVLEKALMGISDKMEARFKIIEDKLGSLNKNTDSPHKKPPCSTQHTILQTDQKPHYHTTDQNSNPFNSIRNKCSCERGDTDSCEVMQDVKSSIYRLNDILSTSFTPTVISGFNFPASNLSISSPLESFYSQFRQLQEKQRAAEFRNKLQSESWKRPLLNAVGTNYMRDFNGVEAMRFNPALNSSQFTGTLEDPVNRARNLVLREQARSWKQQQQYLSASEQQGFIPMERSHNFSISDISPSRASSGLSEQSTTLQYPFLKFEPDPETEYNEWMSRLKTLQEKIRSHTVL